MTIRPKTFSLVSSVPQVLAIPGSGRDVRSVSAPLMQELDIIVPPPASKSPGSLPPSAPSSPRKALDKLKTTTSRYQPPPAGPAGERREP
jgi:hypothetical protein